MASRNGWYGVEFKGPQSKAAYHVTGVAGTFPATREGRGAALAAGEAEYKRTGTRVELTQAGKLINYWDASESFDLF
jgi:hypothetical protein